jgi:hypothetical protein
VGRRGGYYQIEGGSCYTDGGEDEAVPFCNGEGGVDDDVKTASNLADATSIGWFRQQVYIWRREYQPETFACSAGPFAYLTLSRVV